MKYGSGGATKDDARSEAVDQTLIPSPVPNTGSLLASIRRRHARRSPVAKHRRHGKLHRYISSIDILPGCCQCHLYPGAGSCSSRAKRSQSQDKSGSPYSSSFSSTGRDVSHVFQEIAGGTVGLGRHFEVRETEVLERCRREGSADPGRSCYHGCAFPRQRSQHGGSCLATSSSSVPIACPHERQTSRPCICELLQLLRPEPDVLINSLIVLRQ